MALPSISRIGYGSMNLTWAAKQTQDGQAFGAILQAIEGAGDKVVMINSGQFYGTGNPTLNLSLLSRFYKAHPEAADKTLLSVKGGIRLKDGQMTGPDGTIEGLRWSVTDINEKLASEGGQKKMDLFEMARVDPKVEIEEVIKNLVTLKDEGHFKFIGLSECSASTIRRASKIHPIAAVEVEYSLWSLDIERNEVLATCKELGIPIIAYSPLGRGFLTGKIKSPDDLPEGDMRRHFDKFKDGAFQKNFEIVKKIEAIAAKKGCSPAQLALAWLVAQWEGIHPIPGSTRPEGVKEAFDALQVFLSVQDLAELRELVDSSDIVGGRYNSHAAGLLEG